MISYKNVLFLVSINAAASMIPAMIRIRNNMDENINVNLNKQQNYEGQLQFNNVKNNIPLSSGFQLALLVGLVLAGNVTFLFLDYTFNESSYFYEQHLYKGIALIFIYNIVLYLIKKKKMRKYFWKYVSDVIFWLIKKPIISAYFLCVNLTTLLW